MGFIMKPTFLKLSFLFFCSLSLLHAQPSGYVLVKTSGSTYVASNHTATGNNFRLLLTLPTGKTGPDVVVADGTRLPSSSAPGLNGVLWGPVSIAANSTVTLNVVGTPPVEGFALLSDSQLGRASVLSLTSNPTLGPVNGSADRGLVHSAAAAPNVSRNNQPIDFLVNLNASARMELSLFTLAGEKVYEAQAQGNTGMNTLAWNLTDNTGGSVANGLYLFYLRVVGGDGTVETRTGKTLVIK